jgi:hypothetical protein
MFMVKARPLTQFLEKGAFAPMEDETLKYAFELFKSILQVTPILRNPN